ncbi:hypothetical protein [Moorena sp. SIO3I8]|uniref:hypothetical protein n=1 Tax=Moorena sp. SIO3I8 TaxID=2607833 RepID=UPI0013C12662|nr:hypothetical protein [Moorena sp. SIO3I8]NEO07895.1 hypothetical protein [Moorena sp. SIO3I8]
MALSIVEQFKDINPKVAFADAQNQCTQAESTVAQLAQNGLPDVGNYQHKIEEQLPQVDFTNVKKIIAQVPLSAGELKAELSGKIDQLTELNFDSLTAAIPLPKAADFGDLKIADEIKDTISSLTQDLIGSFSIGELPTGTPTIFGEFEEFVTKAGMLPVRTLDVLFKGLKKLLDKLSDPDELLKKFESQALTEIFKEQINSLAEQLPSKAISRIESNIKRRIELIAEYNKLLDSLKDPTSLKKEQFKELIKRTRAIAREFESIDASTDTALANLKNFNITNLQTALEELISSAGGGATTGVLVPFFNNIKTYIETLTAKVGTITDKLREFAHKIPKVIEQAISQVEEIATKVTKAITDKIQQGEELLNKVKSYLEEIIQKVKEFLKNTYGKSQELVKPFKKVCNEASTTIVGKVDEFSKNLEQQTDHIKTSIESVNTQIKTQLNREQLDHKINQLFDKVTAILDSPQINDTLKQAEDGMRTITENLKEVSLKPAFQVVVTKSNDLEKELKAVDVSTLSTPVKTALKVGTEVIKAVDVPGVVNPELKAAFDEILAPLDNIVALIEGEFNKINDKIESLQPGTLVVDFLEPYLTPVINKLNEYKPSILLQPVKNFYNDIIEKLEVINPKQLLDLLEELYEKLLGVIESLSPKTITDFLNQQLATVKTQLDNLPVEKLVGKVTDGLSQVDKLMANIGLSDVLKSDFWNTLQEILSFSFAEKIQEVEKIRDGIVTKVNAVDEQGLTQQLQELQNAIATYTQTPDDLATDGVAGQVTAYQQVVATLPAPPAASLPTLPAEIAVDYEDLRKRLENLYQNFTATSPQEVLEQVNTIVTDTTRLQGNESQRDRLQESANRTSPQQVMANFKQVIPDELNRQIVNPLREILQALDKLLEQPRTVLGDIGNVIKIIEDAPKRLVEILSQVAQTLGDQIRQAINGVKNAIDSLTNEVVKAIEGTYTTTLETLKSLRPKLLLNSFDESDFKDIDSLIQKLAQPEDNVSKYINSKLSETTKLLLKAKTEGTKQAVIRELNNLLLQEDFYNKQRFEGVTLTTEVKVLSLGDYKSDLVHFNRLLIEASYTQDLIVMNMESIFPYLKDKLKEIYPQNIVDELDQLHGNIIQLLRDIPQAVGDALDSQYQQKVVQKTEKLRGAINKLFLALRQRLEQLKSELDIGLEDVADSFDRLLNALPV